MIYEQGSVALAIFFMEAVWTSFVGHITCLGLSLLNIYLIGLCENVKMFFEQ